ncbi:LysR family transcriptional regulator [Novosphingobium cyanobacteriorum]|uniref:LysR family transcriptional regulator n=1 Tax=Novosphingobium cyanobacteriorum TaxID=3024215 RepID=A0ABT6CJB0_9SPHN|nr:LysR family transcriptional regulator [Novosphingobium cyanobacteriorum]MDF8333653.1 LysR family transcriptional regulator [Novosphingobium cyanobacteriorum]
MIERHLLRYFLAVVDTGTFSGAASLCRVSQPTVSSGIARLEHVAGQVLFNRSNRRVELTAAGARLLPHARRIENEFAEAQRSVTEIDPATVVRLGVASTLATGMVERVAAALLAKPGLQLEVVERRPGEMATLLDRGRVDLVMGPLDGAASRRHVTLFHEPFELVMREGHHLAGADLLRCDDLMDEAMLVRRQCEALPQVSRFFTARGVRPFMAARSQSEERIAGYVRAGLGLTVMPRSLIEPGIVARPLAGLELERTVGLTFDADGEGRLTRAGVIETIAQAVAQHG